MTLATLLLGFILPRTYQAEAVLLPKRNQNSDLSAIMGGLSNTLGGLVPFGAMGGLEGNQTQDLVDILESRTIAERMTDRLDLGKKFQGWKTREDLIRKVRKAYKVTPPGLKKNVLYVRSEVQDPKLAAAIVNTAVEELEKFVDEVGYSDTSRNRRFLEEQLTKTKQVLSKTEQELADFQTKNGLLSLPETVASMLKMLGELEAKQLEASAALSGTQQLAGELSSKVRSLQADPADLLTIRLKEQEQRAQQRALEKTRADFTQQLNSLPPKGMALARLQRELQIQNAVYMVLMQQYQTALIAEQKEVTPFMVLDKATVPERPAFPKPFLMAAMAFVFSLFAGVGLVFWLESNRVSA